jgi:hypothetical protein
MAETGLETRSTFPTAMSALEDEKLANDQQSAKKLSEISFFG